MITGLSLFERKLWTDVALEWGCEDSEPTVVSGSGFDGNTKVTSTLLWEDISMYNGSLCDGDIRQSSLRAETGREYVEPGL